MEMQIEKLVTLLRQHLVVQGELLALLEQQHLDILANNVDQTLVSTAQIQVVCKKITEMRAQILKEFGIPVWETQRKLNEESTLFRHIPEEYSPLVVALIEEMRNLNTKIQTQLAQNIQALAVSTAKMKEILCSISNTEKIGANLHLPDHHGRG
jgi:hypothetical protein